MVEITNHCVVYADEKEYTTWQQPCEWPANSLHL
jgi:hypothetical protein